MRVATSSFALMRLALVPQLRPAVRCCASTTGGVNGALQEVRGRLSSVVTSGSLSASVRMRPCTLPRPDTHRIPASLRSRAW